VLRCVPGVSFLSVLAVTVGNSLDISSKLLNIKTKQWSRNAYGKLHFIIIIIIIISLAP
jgi:hypothetical protein